MGTAKLKEVPNTLNTVFWTKDFFKAVTPVAPTWAVSAREHRQQAITEGTLTYRTLANAFRDHMDLTYPTKGRTQVAKGAFQAQGQDTGIDGATGDAQNVGSEGVAGGRTLRGKESGKRPTNKRKASPDENSGQVCQACGLYHPLKACWYVFPDGAPRWWKPKAEILQEVEEKMKSDTSFKKQVQKVKGKRTKKTPEEEKKTVTFTEDEDNES